jgi:hypothetical protein
MDPFRITSYNVRCFPWFTVPIRSIVQWLVAHSDIVVLQEVWCQHAHWKQHFASYGWSFLKPVRESHILSLFGSGLVVAWRSKDWDVGDSRFYPFLPSAGLDIFVVKGWFRVELFQKSSQKTLRIINTHMQSDYEICDELWRPIAEPIRMAQAFQLSEIERCIYPLPTLIIGDMNSELCWMQDCVWLTQHSGPTFANTTQVLDHCASWIEHSWKLLYHKVFRVTFSDHWPVVWKFCQTSMKPVRRRSILKQSSRPHNR